MRRLARLLSIAAASLSCAALAQSTSPADVGGYAYLTTAPDDAAVRSLIRRQADTGDPRSMVEYAELLRQSITGDYDEAMRWRAEGDRVNRAAAERGDALAQINAGVRCHESRGIQTLPGVCRDDAEAVRWFKRAMDQGNADGMAFYGYMVEHGLGGLEKNREQAVGYYQEALRRGSRYASAFLAGDRR